MANNIIRRTWKQGGMVNIEDLRGSAFQAEDGGHTFLISGVDENGDALALSGTPAGVLLRADGQDVTLTCSVSDGVVSATLPANAYVVPGRIGITIFLTNGGQKTAIYAAIAAVATTSSGTVAPPAGSDVVDLVNAIATAVATIPASYTDLMAAVAPTYSTSALYAVGSYAWYSGKLYRCTTAITSGETWTSAHWTQANLGSDVNDLKSAFEPVEKKVVGDPPYYKYSNTYNPNPGHEGEGYPAGTYGVGKCLFDVTAYRGKTVYIYGAQIGYIMQFTDSPSPSNYIANTKRNAEKNTEYYVAIEQTAKYLSINVWDSTDNARICDDQSLPVVASVKPKVDEIESLINGVLPYYTYTNTYNPNPGHEGEGYPAGTYGVGKCLFDVSKYQGKTVILQGAQFGWLMQFTDTPSPSNYIENTKQDINEATTCYITVATGAKCIAANVWDSTANAIMFLPGSFAKKEELPQMQYYNKNNCTFIGIGDSITHGSGASTYSKGYFTLLARKLESAEITNQRLEAGVSSAASQNIAANVGAILNTITEDVTIPADTSNIEISLSHPIYDAGRNLVKVNPCYLNGIEGTLTKTASGTKYYYKRNSAGSAKFTPSGTAFITYSCLVANNSKVAVIFVGTNDGLNSHPENMNNTLSAISAIVRQIKTNLYVVVSPYVNSTISEFREALGNTYGQRFFDLYNYFSKQAVYDAIAEGLIQSGSQEDWQTLLTTDSVHPNDAGHQLIAERIFERMGQIGFLYK